MQWLLLNGSLVGLWSTGGLLSGPWSRALWPLIALGGGIAIFTTGSFVLGQITMLAAMPLLLAAIYSIITRKTANLRRYAFFVGHPPTHPGRTH